MVIIITRASHTGKTHLAQRQLERYGYPYLSIDHLKMRLIRSGLTDLTPLDDDKLTIYLWSIVREIIKTAIENRQNLIVEGCYVPFYFKDDFADDYLSHIQSVILVFSEEYIEANYDTIINYRNVIEKRLSDAYPKETMIKKNKMWLEECRGRGQIWTNRYLF